MTDTHAEAAQVAAVLAARGFAARVVNQGDSHGVEMKLDDESTTVWSLTPTGWSYVVMSETDGVGYRITSSGFAEVGIHDVPERVAFVIANFPYDGEMDDDAAREEVARLLASVEDMSDEERERILSVAIPHPEPDRETMAWRELVDSGMLWAINRHLLNPAGLSMVLRYEQGEPVGWALTGELEGPMQMDRLADQDGFRRFYAFMESLSEN